MTKPEALATYQQRQAEYVAICKSEAAIFPRKDPALTAAANRAHEARWAAFVAWRDAK